MSQTERIFFIDRMIRERGGTTVAYVARHFEVSGRQVKRDIEYMRDRLMAPIVWRKSATRYEYSGQWGGLRFADENSFFAFAFLESILHRYAYVPVVSEDTINLLRDRIAGRYSAISDKVRYELPDLESIDGEISYALCHGLLSGCLLGIRYTDSKGEHSERNIVALRLVNYGGKWYCIALDSRSLQLRTFAVSRIKEPRELGKPDLPLPSAEEIERYLSSSYGIFKGEPVGTATLRFYGGAARAVQSQQWHHEQTITPVPVTGGAHAFNSKGGFINGGDSNGGGLTGGAPEGGGLGSGVPKANFSEGGATEARDPDAIDLSLPVHDWTELLGRALRCGANCEVIGPPEFREKWVEEIEKMGRLAGEE